MQVIILLFSICWFMLCGIKLKYGLHMLQIEGYKNEKYIEWIDGHKDKVFTSKDKIYTVISITNAIFFIILPQVHGDKNLYFHAMINLVFTFAFLFLNFKTKYNAKKPFVLTKRSKRLIAVAFLLVIIDFTIVVVLVRLFGAEISRFFPVWAGFLAIIYLFSSYYIAGGNIILKPVENKINKKYYEAASDKIKNIKNLTSLGITGSYGKTSTKFAATTILKEKYKVLNTPESYNTPMGISKIINSQLNDEYEIFVSELGATKVGDIKEVAALVNPKIGIITSIGPCHLETFKSVENIMRTKYELIEMLPMEGVAIFNYDNEYVKKLADKTFKKKILYGIKSIEDADVFATDIKVGSTGSKFMMCINGLGTVECETKLLGEHNILNILAGASAAKVLGLSLEEIARGISKIESIEHRLQLIDPDTGVLVVDDAYNSNPDGAKAALDVLDSFTDRRKIIITPGMVELGTVEEEENEKYGKNIAKVCHIAILVGQKRIEPIYRGLKKQKFNENNIYVVNSLNEASELLKTLTKVNDVVLFENDLPDTYNE